MSNHYICNGIIILLLRQTQQKNDLSNLHVNKGLYETVFEQLIKEGKRNACANLCSKILRVPRMDTTGIGGGRSQKTQKKQLPNHGVILVFRYNHFKADECNAPAPHSALASTLFGSWGNILQVMLPISRKHKSNLRFKSDFFPKYLRFFSNLRKLKYLHFSNKS